MQACRRGSSARVPSARGPVGERELPDVSLVDGMATGEPVPEGLPVGLEPLLEGLEGLRWGNVGHRELVGQPWFVDVEGGRHVEDGPAVLDGNHQAGGEGPTIPDPVHLVEDGHIGIPRSQEVRVQRVRSPAFDRSPGGHQRLCRHLAAEHALTVLIGAHTPKDVDLDGLEIEKVDQKIEGFTHAPILTGGRDRFERGPRTPWV